MREGNFVAMAVDGKWFEKKKRREDAVKKKIKENVWEMGGGEWGGKKEEEEEEEEEGITWERLTFMETERSRNCKRKQKKMKPNKNVK